MAIAYNRVILIGNLTRDPELRYTPSGTAVCDLSIAVNNTRGRGNDRREETCFVDVTVWDRMAENCSEYLSKGRSVLIEGRLRQDTWDDKETGRKRSKLAVTASTVQFLPAGGAGGGGAGGGEHFDDEGGRQPSRRGAPQGNSPEPFNDGFDPGDDVPF